MPSGEDTFFRTRGISLTLSFLLVVGGVLAYSLGWNEKIPQMTPATVISGVFGAVCCALLFQIGLWILALCRERVAEKAGAGFAPSKKGTHKVLQYWDRKPFESVLDDIFHPYPKVVRYENGDIEHWPHPDSNHPSWKVEDKN